MKFKGVHSANFFSATRNVLPVFQSNMCKQALLKALLLLFLVIICLRQGILKNGKNIILRNIFEEIFSFVLCSL